MNRIRLSGLIKYPYWILYLPSESACLFWIIVRFYKESNGFMLYFPGPLWPGPDDGCGKIQSGLDMDNQL